MIAWHDVKYHPVDYLLAKGKSTFNIDKTACQPLNQMIKCITNIGANTPPNVIQYEYSLTLEVFLPSMFNLTIQASSNLQFYRKYKALKQK